MDNLNSLNSVITKEAVEKMLKMAGINKQIKNIELYQRAFTHKSYVKDVAFDFLQGVIKLKEGIVDFQEKSNERYEFCGDSVICHVCCEYLFDRFETEDEGIMTKLKTIIVSREYLAKFARYYGFIKYLLLSNHMENVQGRDNDRLLEDCFESFICALNKDLGFEVAKKFILNAIEENVNFSRLLYLNENFKDRILYHYQRNGWGYAKYELVCEMGPPTKRTFISNCYYQHPDTNRKVIDSQGYGLTKKDAEMDASRRALEKYNKIDPREHIVGRIKR